MVRRPGSDRSTDTWSEEVEAADPAVRPLLAERYRDAETLGHGNIGIVKLVFDERLGRKVAYKLLKSEQSANAVARFLREAMITAQLDHPGIVAVHDIGREPDGTRYYTMRYVRGETLAERIRSAHDLPARLTLVGHFADLCQAVGYAHSKGVIHRDLKPANVMVGDFGETQILDWGLAKTLDDAADEEISEIGLPHVSGAVDATAQGALVGTPAYMSPEQANGRPADARSDVWSLGVVLYEILSGTRPFSGSGAFAVLRKVRDGERLRLREAAPRAPVALAAIAEKAMSVDPAQRYPDARAFAADVEAWMTGAPVSAYQDTWLDQGRRFVAAYRLPLAVGGTAVVALATIGLVSVVQIVAERNRAREAEIEANRGLRDLYADRAVEASEDGREADATLFAVASLRLGENPEARGLLMGSSDRRWPVVRGTLNLACNDAVFLAEDTVACASNQGLFLWDVEAATVRKVGSVPTWVLARWPDGSVVAYNREREGWRVAPDGEVTHLTSGPPASDNLFVAVADDGTLGSAGGSSFRAWRDDEPALQLSIPNGPLSGLSWNPRRGFTVSTMSAPTFTVDLASERLVAVSGTEHLGARDAAWSSDGAWLAVGTTDGGVHVVDPATGATPFSFASHRGPVNSVAWALDDAVLASASEDGVLALDRASDGSRLSRFSLPTASGLAVSPSGRLLAFDRNQPITRVFDVKDLVSDPSTMRIVGDGLAMSGFTPEGDVVGFYGTGALRVWRRDGRRTDVQVSNHLLKAGAVSPDGRFIAAGVTNGDLVVLNPDLAERFRVSAHGVVGVAITDDARWILASVRAVDAGHTSGLLKVDAQTGSYTWLFEGLGPRDVDTRGDLVAVVDNAGHAHAVDLVTGAAWTIEVDAREIAVIGPGDVAVAGDDGQVSRWRLADGHVTSGAWGGAHPHSAPIDGLAVSDDGAFLATASWDQTAAIWETGSGRLRAVLRGHTNRVADVAFSADGRALVTSSWDGTIRRWDLGKMNADPSEAGARVTRDTGLALREGRVVPAPGVSPP